MTDSGTGALAQPGAESDVVDNLQAELRVYGNDVSQHYDSALSETLRDAIAEIERLRSLTGKVVVDAEPTEAQIKIVDDWLGGRFADLVQPGDAEELYRAMTAPAGDEQGGER